MSDFDTLWTIGLLFFGVHLVLLGFIAVKANYIPRFIGLLLILASLGYSIDGFSKMYLAGYSVYKIYFEMIVIFTAVVGELSFTIWLLVKGFSRKSLSI